MNNDYLELFDKNGEIELIGSYNKLNCEVSYCCGYLDYLHNVSYGKDIIGIKLKRISKYNKTYFYAIIFQKDITEDKRTKISEGKLIQISETKFQIENDPNAVLVFKFDVNTCSPSNNPIENFNIVFSSNRCRRPGWEKKLGGAYWGDEEQAALKSVYSFLDNDAINFDKYISSLNEIDNVIDDDVRNSLVKQDSTEIVKIKSLISNNELGSAAIEFSKLNFPQKELKNEIFEKLKNYTSNDIDSISDIEFQKFLTENKQKLKDLSKGKHTLKSDLSGNLSIDNYEKIIGKLNSKHSKLFGSFEVPVKAQCTFEVTSAIENVGDQKMYTRTTKSIYQKSNNKYFRSNKPSEKHKEIYVIYDPIIPKNKLRIMQPRIEYYRIGNIIISEKQAEPKIIKESKVHVDVSRIVSKSTKITAISALVFWGGLRLYEYYKIP